MNELVDLIVNKKLPAPVGAQIDGLLRNDAAIQQGENLLEQAGVDTVVELAQRNATALYETLVKTNETKKLVRKLPTADQVAQWVTQAKSLPRAVEY